MDKIDKKDLEILEVLKENSRLSTQEISKKTSIPITTVHNRLKHLKKEGVIKKFTVELDYKKVGKPISAFILVGVDYKLLKEIKMSQYQLAKKIKQNEAVEIASMVTGTSDIIVTNNSHGDGPWSAAETFTFN
ncbi:Lrp/AsnC family transcriptional regulator, partial [Candidatus Woesearchaeota archaeon]|nr:Lrp/AsnC family transcriptional regulator [Candidatus Woesearchaeota archaeon]